MGLLDKIFHNTRHLIELRKLISKEYFFRFHEDRLNDSISGKSAAGFLKKHEICNPLFKVEGDRLHLEGRKEAGCENFDFNIFLTPGVVWHEREHSLVFQLEGHPAVHKNFFCLLLKSIVFELSDGIARNHAHRKPEITFENNLMAVSLDGIHSDFQSIITSMEITEISCRDKNILIKFKIIPSRAFKNPILILSLIRKMR